MTLQEFKDSVLPWQRMMYSVAIRIGLTADDAADAVQEAVIHLWRSRERLAGVDDLKPYCLKTLRNVCISQLRGRHAMAPVEALESVGVDDFTTQKMDCSPERVRALLDRLPESWRTVVRMRCLAGMEYAEIAAATGYSQSNVRQMLSRARKELRKYFE